MRCTLKWGNSVKNSTKLPLIPKCFLMILSQLLYFFFALDAMCKQIVGIKPIIIVAWLFVGYLELCPVDLIQAVSSRFYTHLKSITCMQT